MENNRQGEIIGYHFRVLGRFDLHRPDTDAPLTADNCLRRFRPTEIAAKSLGRVSWRHCWRPATRQ